MSNVENEAAPASATESGDPNLSLNAEAAKIYIAPVHSNIDFVTVFGLVISLGLIGVALFSAGSPDAFLNAPSLMIVVGGTIAVTAMSFSGAEVSQSWGIIKNSLIRKTFNPAELARSLMDISVLARKHGLLALAKIENRTRKDIFLNKAAQMVSDGYTPMDIERILTQKMDTLVDRHRKGASMLQRAADVAPAMGLIGTLVGLVQMLTNLADPSSIGPSMAIALLTTFYGAIMSTVIFAPLAAKLERNSKEEILLKGLIKTAMVSIAKQENPRRLEMLLNSDLPPSRRIKYFK